MGYPALRYLDIVPVEHEGEQMFCLHDPDGVVQHQVLLSPFAFFIAAQLDGARGVEEIQHVFRAHSGGAEIDGTKIEEVVRFLDEHGFLQSDSFSEMQSRIANGFLSSASRPAYLAGKAYPDDANALRAYIDAFFERSDGPGERPTGSIENDVCLRGLVVPHIDFERGGHSYAHGFLKVARKARPETVIVFGVAHASPPAPFVLTRKGFETPFGTVPCNVELVERLAEACAFDPFEYEIVHRTEHSIEFQAVMLAYLYGEAVRIVPVLCGPFDFEGDAEPIRRFLGACQEIVREGEGSVMVLAGADLAHVGQRFGDDFEIDDMIVADVEKRDREDLTHVLAPDAESWFASVMKDRNARRVCGINCIYATLKSVDGTVRSGDLLHYGYAPDPAGGIVSFAGITLT